MWIFPIVLSVILSVFSTAVMAYISMATPIGPWISSTLVLMAILIFKIFGQKESTSQKIALITMSGSIGGILATAVGFSFPTLFFLDPKLFNSWMANPAYFIAVLGSFSLVAGWFGFWIANIVEHTFIVEEQLPFPIGALVYKMIAAQQQVQKAWELVVGFVSTAFFCVLQDGFLGLKGIIPKSLTLVPSFSFSVIRVPAVPLDLWPLLWAIGFVTGSVIAVPLAVGAMARIFVVDPLNHSLFPAVNSIEFILAFCSGMVLAGALQGLLDMPKIVWSTIKKIVHGVQGAPRSYAGKGIQPIVIIEAIPLLLCLVVFLTYFKFSALAQLYLLVFSFICTYQMTLIAGKIGLAQLGRFATFVMVPALFLFKLDLVQIVIIATFVETCGGVAADVLFGRKIAHMGSLPPARVKAYQYLGLVVSALTVGCVFWLLINHFQLGSAELFAQKAQSRQLLINVKSFDYCILLLGIIFGVLLKYMKFNPMLVLGGLLMPLNISLGLIVGGFASLLTADREQWYPFWSGVFASNSVWMLVKALV